ncbi:MAG: hypothetical protein ACJ72W_01550 [Actinoallomurus sp.]|jgi:hypothetical protein
MVTRIWAPDPLDELGGRSGLVDLDDDELAASLITSGKANDPRDGAFAMRHPGADYVAPTAGEPSSTEAGASYSTRDAKPARRRGKADE